MLRPLQNLFDPQKHPQLLAGLSAPDDAAVWLLDTERALILTTDFFTPVVDTPYDYGAIAAANSLSDVYAMGGTPFLALNVAALPPDLPEDISAEIILGGAHTIRQAGAVLAGGHTVQDKEPKFGYVVAGFCHPQHVLTKGGAQPGDVLLLSKPLGTGCITTALKRSLVHPTDLSEAIGWMKRLNDKAALLARTFGATAATDITGFGLLGHASEMAQASKVALHLQFDQIPLLRGAHRYAEDWIFPGGSSDNRMNFGEWVTFAPQIDEAHQMLLFDAQTSGGLLFSLPPENLPALRQRAAALGQPVWQIGRVTPGRGISIE